MNRNINPYQHTGHKIINMTSAEPGWRVHLIERFIDSLKHTAEPVAGWLTIETWPEDIDGTPSPFASRGVHVVPGIRSYDLTWEIVPAHLDEYEEGFWFLAAPGEPDPTAEQITAEITRRERLYREVNR